MSKKWKKWTTDQIAQDKIVQAKKKNKIKEAIDKYRLEGLPQSAWAKNIALDLFASEEFTTVKSDSIERAVYYMLKEY